LYLGGVTAIKEKSDRIKKARLQRFAKLVAYCNTVASKNVDVTDIQIALNQTLVGLQKINYLQADDQFELDGILEDLEIMLPNEITTAQQQLVRCLFSPVRPRKANESVGQVLVEVLGAEAIQSCIGQTDWKIASDCNTIEEEI